jgi:hypothetical protein
MIPIKYTQPAPGTSGIWQHGQNVRVDNTFGAMPKITYNEEKLAQVNGEVIAGPAATDPRLTADMTDPATSFVCPSGATRTYEDVADILTGLYFFLAFARDAQMLVDAQAQNDLNI